MGDVKLAALLGAVLGKSVVAALFVGVCSPAASFAAGVLVREGPCARKKTIAVRAVPRLRRLLVLLVGGH